ncbi:MAG TPA: RraA family protein [Streptosporangiaceae bacterium]|nr:RraA family protein [Streptosporangiaceae bacterium]
MPEADDGGAGPDLLARASEVDTCAVSDALDRLNLTGVVHGLACRSGSQRRISGRVRTVKVGPRHDDTPRPHLGAGAIMASGPGDVIVVDNRGRLDVSSWGGILSLAASQRGIEGVVVDGACRDVAEAAGIGFAVFARAVVPTSARGRIVEESTGQPVTVGTVRVEPGDLVVADPSGVAFVPARAAAEVLGLAEAIMAKERAMAAAVRAGQSIVEVMHDRSFDSVHAARRPHDKKEQGS